MASWINNSDLKGYVLLDNESTVDAFCNPNLISNIHEVDETMTLRSNGGTIKTSQMAKVKGYGDVWFNKDFITNIICLKNIKKKYRVTYDSKADSAFIVHRVPRLVPNH